MYILTTFNISDTFYFCISKENLSACQCLMTSITFIYSAKVMNLSFSQLKKKSQFICETILNKIYEKTGNFLLTQKLKPLGFLVSESGMNLLTFGAFLPDFPLTFNTP